MGVGAYSRLGTYELFCLEDGRLFKVGRLFE